ncbi:aminodeoxychorismate synthase component I [Desulfatitalea alkaliphila]|uniref:aminodeoxychorismate synthase n=1 Tax=Desulfatitalea alkaliphila TaxID=2929485 RepID=A0AA41UJB8_9BACT|nr:aminodeoxychorismate synthase component I [Desulfatitalea alkaliphila]MCJ8500382.1 aminodeoxychorismate synthase component I [Desulfatitalea alkaliphila]
MNLKAVPSPFADLPGMDTVTGVHARPFDLREPFEALCARFAALPGTVALLSGGDLDCARYHLLGLWPWMVLSGRAGRVILSVDGTPHRIDAPPLAVLETLLDRLQLPTGQWPAPMAAGLMGYLAYDLKDDLERLPRTSVDDLLLPHMLFFAPSLLVVHDKTTGATRLMVPLRARASETPDHIIDGFRAACDGPPAEAAPFCLPAAGRRANVTPEAYQQAVGRVIDYIAAGDVYQVNLSQRFQVPFDGDAYALFRHLYARNPAPFFAFIQAGDHQIVSTSPERFVQQSGRRVEARPIKGTRPRGATAEADAALRAELAASTKDDAELSMIVDLLRNDLGKVCRAGSVHVTEHKRIEAYRNVYHLVTRVEGELDRDTGSVDLIRAAFPGGSITGCPKVRAMEIIDELEPCRRHLYCGSIGYISLHDTMDLSIAIRTAIITGGILHYSAGGGVVYDSDPRSEYEETLHKAHTLLTACQATATDAVDPSNAVVWCNGRLQPAAEAAVPVADQGLLYGYGFFETLRADHGRAPLLAAHLARFNATWRALMPDPPPDVTWDAVIAAVIAANGLQVGCAAVKLLATRGSRAAAPWDHTLLVTARPYTHRAAVHESGGLALGTYPHPRQSPLADHKTLNYLYYLQAGQWAAAKGHDEALILNPDGTVSETNTANLLLIEGREVSRPESPAVLPGVMAAAVCDQLARWGYRIRWRPVQPSELHGTGQLLAANALMGAVPIHAIDGRPRPAGGPLWRRINDAILPGWEGA